MWAEWFLQSIYMCMEPSVNETLPSSYMSSRGQFNVNLPIREFYKRVNFRDHFEVKFYVLTSAPPCVTKSQLLYFLGIFSVSSENAALMCQKILSSKQQVSFLFPVSRLTTQVISFISSLHTSNVFQLFILQV